MGERSAAYSARHYTTDSDRVYVCYYKHRFNFHNTARAPQYVKVYTRWVLRNLTDQHRTARMGATLEILQQ